MLHFMRKFQFHLSPHNALYNVPFGHLGHLHFCLYFNTGHAWFLRYEPLYWCNTLMQYFNLPALILKTGCCPCLCQGETWKFIAWGLPLSSECYQPSALLMSLPSWQPSSHSIRPVHPGDPDGGVSQSPTSFLLLLLPSLSLERHFVKVIKQGSQ